MPDGGGLRHNKGKLRYSLEPTVARIDSVKNLMRGAEKYDDFNWARGMSWSTVIECLERHVMAIKAGQDIDPDDGLPHAAKVISNAQFLLQYLRTYPKGDDRRHRWLEIPKIGLDIDEVIGDFVGAWIKRFGGKRPTSYAWRYDVRQMLEEMGDDEEFYMNIEPIVPPEDIPFEPHCYITARGCSTKLTERWIEKCGFPAKPVINVGLTGNKIAAIKLMGVEVFVEDRFEAFVECNKAGVPCFLFDRPHNRRYDVGFRRIKHLNQLLEAER